MTTLAILCSGQGFQGAGMFDLVADAEAARPVFAKAASILGRDPRELVASGGDGAMHANATAQILCCTQALAAWAVIGPRIEARLVVAGYSVGEVAAWGVAGALDAAQVLDLVAERARLMDAATTRPSGLIAVRGLSEIKLREIFRSTGVHLAIRNAADQFVLGGTADRLEEALQAARAAGAVRVTPLPVTVPSHTPLLRQAARDFSDILRKTTDARSPKARLLSGVDGNPVLDVAGGIEKLGRQVAETVDWSACMDACRSAGAGQALELGPGAGLARMMADLVDGCASRSLAEFRGVDGAVAWLHGR